MSTADRQTRQQSQSAARTPLARAGVDLRNDATILAVLDDARDAEPHDLFSPTAQPPTDPSHIPPLPAYISAALSERAYEPAQARVYSQREVREGRNAVTTKTTAHAFIEHPYGAVVEFPETGAIEGQSIAHRFSIDPEHPSLPHHSIQYSTGTTVHGVHEANCRLIRADGKPVKCKVYSYTCASVRSCSFKGVGEMLEHAEHSFTSPSRQAAERRASHVGNAVSLSPDALVFRKTIAFFAALSKHGCSLKDDPRYAGDHDDPQPPNPYLDSRAKPRHMCSGELRVKENQFGQMMIECEHRSAANKCHLQLRNLQDFDTDYLKALLCRDTATIRQHEESAAARGYGPLVTCNQVRSCRSQSQHCSMSHRMPDGSLEPGRMSKAQKCSAKFSVYVPVDLAEHPHVVMLCTNPHSHAAPERSMTPPVIRDAFQKMLKAMDWRLADATPRRVQLDSGFMNALRHSLSWTDVRNPTLADLHPSLQNHDHVAYLIDRVRKPTYPFGTDFDGARHLYETQRDGPRDDQYVRFVGEITIAGEKPAKMVVCISPAQSQRFLKARRPEIDSAYNRVHGWVEFEMEEWDIATSQSVTLCRAFISSQSAEAHQALFREIFRIVEQDTGQKIHFRHLHGDGIEIVTADEHKGQAKGLGLALVEVAQGMLTHDEFEPQKRLCDLTPYDHLARIYRLCVVHFKRNILKIKNDVSSNVLAAMYSLASAQPHPDIEHTLAIIRGGGPKAQSWLRDKEGFAISALYQPKSKIPLNVWRAGKSNSNGVEQKHRNVNRDGKHLSMMGGIHLGMQHDAREQRSGEIAISEGIHPRYRPSTDEMREERSLTLRTDKRKLASDENTSTQQKRARPLSPPLPPSPTPISMSPSHIGASYHTDAMPAAPIIPTVLVPSQAPLFPAPHLILYPFIREVCRQRGACLDITNWIPPVALADISQRMDAALALDVDTLLRGFSQGTGASGPGGSVELV